MKLLKWLSVTDRFTKAYLDEQMAPFGINSSQHMYLLKICAQPGISQDSLLNSFYVHPSNIVRMIAALEKRGYITRTPCLQDKRTWLLYPTELALSIVDDIKRICRETETLLLEEFSAEEQIAVENALWQMGKRITQKLHIERAEDIYDDINK